MTLRVLIVDDEAMARRRLARLLSAMPDVRVVGECDDAVSALARARDADVVLLDVHMPGLSGLEALGLLPEGRPVVILCTAHAGYAVDAFAGGARDYLLKPVEAARLRKAIDRAAASLDAHPAMPAALTPPRLAVETRQGIVLLDPADIESAEINDSLVALRAGGAVHLSTRTLADLEASLAEHGFIRVHRRALVNLHHVQRFEPDGASGYVARLRSGHGVEVSRAAARELRRQLRL